MASSVAQTRTAASTAAVLPVLLSISLIHMMNDSMQAVIPAMYPILEKTLDLSYAQVGWIGFMLNMTSSVMQPAVGAYSDKRSRSNLLPIAMSLSLLGMVGIAFAPSFWYVLFAVMFIGFGSAIFHPEGSRVVYFAAGSKRGFAQSVFQVGGNAGSSLAPLMTVFIFVPLGQSGAIWGTLLAAFAIAVSFGLLPWYKSKLAEWELKRSDAASPDGSTVFTVANHPRVKFAMGVLVFLVFARSWYHSGISSYYQFFLQEHYGLTVQQAQIPVFLFLAAGVLGTYFGGVLADRFGLRNMIVFSISGAAPFSLILPHLPLFWVYPLITVLGFVVLSGFSVAVVYAQFLMPAKVGMASGLTTGLAFGMGAIGAVVLGKAADVFGLQPVMWFCSVLPLCGLFAMLLPSDRPKI
ncbi:Fosmidomycin resistance protein [Cohnella kolymensis]|uniref:Fosmidomycin resistance protein n=1 Tax=Cohnella kolymensis TaxID=1590652 RepID=A0ABR5A8X1_9BACL|nr:MFS transporter [Cohnella kolymensis]KIL37442.1 Fosmidomycin resistance protein [Cohnella kolymensis]